MPDSLPPATAAPVRRKRRWLRRLLWWLGLAVLMLWVMKVPLLNWWLHRLPGDFEVSITGVSPGFRSASLTGVKVVHRGTGKLMTYAPKGEVNNGWTQLMKGDLGELVLTQAEVNWRPEFETPEEEPLPLGPPPSPLVWWSKGEARDCVVSWYERGHEMPRLSLKVTRLKGGKMTIYNDGRVEAEEQSVVCDELISREYAMGGTLEIETRSPHAEGVLTAQRKDNRYTAETLKLSAPELYMVWRRSESLPAAPQDVPAPPRPEWDKPAKFLIKNGITEPGRVMFTIHSPNAAPVEFSAMLTRLHTAGLRAGGDLPCIFPVAEAAFSGLKSLGATVEAREFSLNAALDEQTRLHVASATVNDAKVTDSSRLLSALGFTADELKTVPVCSSGIDAKCVNLLIGSHGLSSADPQQFVLENFSAVMPGKKEELAKFPRAKLSAVPDEAFSVRRLRSVVVEKPDLKIDRSEVPAVPKTETPNPPKPATAAPALEGKPEWYGWHADAFAVQEGRLRISGLGFGVKALGHFSVRTERGEAASSMYRIHVNDVALENSFVSSAPMKLKSVVDMDVHPVQFWEKGTVEQIKIDGERVELDEVFLKLLKSGNGSAAAPNEEKPAPREEPPAVKSGTSYLPPLNAKRVVIQNSEVAIDNIGDGRRLVIPIHKQVFENVPLTADVAENDAAHAIHKVEVPGIYLYAPFLEGQTVAELPTNFIYFSFAGLLEKRIERVEMLSPKIKAGAPLFDFIDVMRQRFSGETAAAPKARPRPLLAARDSGSFAAKLALQAVRAAEPAPAVWDIPIFAEYGSIITAPNGLPWPQIPRLPFHNARVREGPDKGKPIPFRLHGTQAHGELAIKPGWYSFPDYKLRIFMSDEGRVVFNFPLKDRDNNLVEVFRNNKVLYKQLMIDKVWLSVTYDKTGIYIGFGGETCGGYINGKFNLYLDQVYSWDASASFTGIDMKPLTSKLAREYVLLYGTVDSLNVTANGDMNGLYQTTAVLKMPRPGRLQIKSLEDWRRKYIDERKDWTDDAARIGLDLLKDFAFTSCEGTAKLFGQEGKILLKLKGKDGSRDYTVNLHDYRRRPDKTLIRF
ncbi:MAG TPA: hypothetical protein VG796_12020 [Verrucomicrobiales bacterium]|nr:hypothetical protein [Verrucomicrobiales bacterium]